MRSMRLIVLFTAFCVVFVMPDRLEDELRILYDDKVANACLACLVYH